MYAETTGAVRDVWDSAADRGHPDNPADHQLQEGQLKTVQSSCY